MRRVLLLSLAVACTTAEPLTEEPDDDGVTFDVTPIGPDPAEVSLYASELTTHPDVAAVVGDHRTRVLAFEVLAEDLKAAESARFAGLLYDYDADIAYDVYGDIDDDSVPVVLQPTTKVPSPTLDEFDDAIALALADDPGLALRVAEGEVSFFTAMPPTIDNDDGDRIISLMVRDHTDDSRTEIAGANLSAQEIVHFDTKAPPTAQAVGFICNPPPDAFQGGPGRGTQGWANLVMRRRGQEIWRMTVRRASSSSGRDGSGVEILDVAYKGTEILEQAHVPILNVQYDNNACGPYRDWQWQEDPFRIGPVIASPAPGITITRWAKTMRELRDDSGNYSGVAVYWDDVRQEAVVISELTAGWYRYMSEWRFGLDGTIRPMFGFDAVQNGCTCRRHNHHVYWRMDFAVGAQPNVVEQYDDVAGTWVRQSTEFQALRDDGNDRKWRVAASTGGDHVVVRPDGPEDSADAYGIADMWVLSDQPGEVEDANGTGGTFPTQARIPSFVNGEDIEDEDIVMWWGAHFIHDDTDPNTNQTHTVKFRIEPNW